MEIFAVFLPLFGAFCAGFLAFVRSTDSHTPNRVDRAAQYVTCGALIPGLVIPHTSIVDPRSPFRGFGED